MYSSAYLPDLQDSIGWFVGRCYYSDAPNSPVAAILSAVQTRGESHGPITQPRELIKLSTIVHYGIRPDAWDDWDAVADEYEEGVQSVINRDMAKSSVVEERDGALWNYTTDGSYVAENFVRKKDNFYLLRAFDESHFANCYFFKKVK